MKLTSLMFLAALGLTACGDYQGLQANCFDGGNNASSNTDVVTRSANNSLNFLPQSGDRVSTSTAPVSDCTFTALGGPGGAEVE